MMTKFDWQPIETVPFDKWVLTWAPELDGSSYLAAPHVLAIFREDGGSSCSEGYPVTATHWMHLPEAPQ